MHLTLSQKSRSRILLKGLLVIGGIFVVRLFWLQIIQYDHYTKQANNEHITEFTLPAERGLIYALDGNRPAPLVLNQPVFLAYADPHEVKDPQAITDAINQIAGGNALQNFSARLHDTSTRYTVLAKGLTKQQATMLKKKNLAGVGFQQGEQRVYPNGSLASQVLGYVNADGKGTYGLESYLDDQLAGKPGQLKAVTDVRQIPLSISDEFINKPAKNGDDIVLNIDQNIQTFAESALRTGIDAAQATKGSIVVMDPNNGHVMAMANYPTYDPAYYSEVAAKDYGVFENGAVSQPYAPGSVMKTIIMGSALDIGAITPSSTYDNTGVFVVDGIPIHNAAGDPVGDHTTMEEVLLHSLNTGVDWILSQMGGGTINQKARQLAYDYYINHFKFGQKSGIEQANEAAGLVHDPNRGSGLNVVYANMAFGYGINVTSLQVAAAFSSLINGGTYYQPQLVAGTLKSDGTISRKSPVILKANTLQPKVAQQMHDLIVQSRRHSPKVRYDTPGYVIGGKTGTAEILDASGKYTSKQPIQTFVGFGGGTQPRYVIMVKVDDSHITANDAPVGPARIFAEVSNWLLRYLRVQPNS